MRDINECPEMESFQRKCKKHNFLGINGTKFLDTCDILHLPFKSASTIQVV